MLNLTFYKPKWVLQNLMREFECRSLLELQKKLKKSGLNEKRELFYGAIFVTGIAHVQTHICVMKSADREPWDIEMVDKTLLDRGDKPYHFFIQNVCLTEHYPKDKLKQGANNMYEIIKEFLYEKKLSPKAGDYRGGLLVFHFGLNIRGKFDLRILRQHVRTISQKNFCQIWITAFSKPNYSEGLLAELLLDDSELLRFPI